MTLILMTFNFAVNWYHSLHKEDASLELVLDRKTSISQQDKSTKQFEHIEHNMHIFSRYIKAWLENYLRWESPLLKGYHQTLQW